MTAFLNYSFHHLHPGCSDRICYERVEAASAILNDLQSHRKGVAEWEKDRCQCVIRKYILNYLHDFENARDTNLMWILEEAEAKYVIIGTNKFYVFDFCRNMLLPALWLLRYGIKKWWQIDYPHTPLVYGRDCNAEYVLERNSFLYRLSSSQPDCITVSHKDNNGLVQNMRITFTRDRREFRFILPNNTRLRSWDEVHEAIRRQLSQATFYSEDSLAQLKVI